MRKVSALSIATTIVVDYILACGKCTTKIQKAIGRAQEMRSELKLRKLENF